MNKSRVVTAAICLLVAMSALPTVAVSRALPEFTSLVETYGPAVVNISTKQSRRGMGQIHGFSVPDLPENYRR